MAEPKLIRERTTLVNLKVTKISHIPCDHSDYDCLFIDAVSKHGVEVRIIFSEPSDLEHFLTAARKNYSNKHRKWESLSAPL